MDFELSREQKAMQETVRRFAADKLAPYAEQWEAEAIFPRAVFTDLAAMGLMGMNCPEDGGGSEVDRLTMSIVLEELARADLGVAVMLSVHNMVAGTVYQWANEEQRERWVRPMTGGALAAFCLTEPEAGSDAGGLRMVAVRDDAGYSLRGTKIFITSGGEAQYYLVMARIDPIKGNRGIGAFVVPAGQPGFALGKLEKKMGMQDSPTRELIFDRCHVPFADRLGSEEDGFRVALSALDGGRVGIGAIAVGLAQAAYEVALDYSQQRVQFGRPLNDFQAIQFMLADMAMQIQAARLLVYQAAVTLEQQKKAKLEASMAKCFASDVAMRVTTDAVQILGGYGYMRDYPVERYMRGAKVLQIVEGTNQIQRLVIAREIYR